MNVCNTIWDIFFGEEKFEEGFTPDFQPALYSYKDPKVKKVIFALKNGSHAAAKVIARHMKPHIPIDAIIIPIPSSKKRGFNQCALIAKYLPSPSYDLLHRKNTDEQKKLGRNRRFKNMEGVFFVDIPKTLLESHFCIIDDVMTTGATICEAKLALERAGATKVTFIVFAH